MLTEFPDVIQGSDEWHAQRRGIVTASVVGRLLTPTLKVADNETSRGLTATLVAERITGQTEPSFTNDDMMRGVLSEPIARDLYSGHFEEATETGFMIRDDWGFKLGYSPDGLVGTDGLIEVKAPRAKGHIATILADKVPEQHMAQIQCGLLVSGRKWLDFISFHGGLPLFVKRVEPDEAWHDAILLAVEAFEQNAWAMEARYKDASQFLIPTERIDFLEVI